MLELVQRKRLMILVMKEGEKPKKSAPQQVNSQLVGSPSKSRKLVPLMHEAEKKDRVKEWTGGCA